MPRSSFADVHLDVDPAAPEHDPIEEEVGDDTPFRILILGDFGGQAPGRVLEIDRDNFDDVLEALDVRIELPLERGGAFTLRPLSIHDFHPDSLHRRLPLPRAMPVEEPAAPPPRPRPAGGPSGTEAALSGSLLDAALDATESRATGAPPPPSSDPFARYVRELVEPHVARPSAPEDRTRAIDTMRAVLHHPRFQQVESAWRALHFLVHELETDSTLTVHVMQMSKAQLLDNLGHAEDLRKTELHSVLTGRRFAVAAGLYFFGPEIDDLNLIGRIGMVARQARTVFLGGAASELLGCRSLAETPYADEWNGETDRQGWDLIRGLPEARHVGLVLPRFLLRVPYGKEGEISDEFPFEEFEGTPRHEDYLWASGSVAAAYLLGRGFQSAGWHMRPGSVLALPDLPIYVYREDGEAKVKPCAEAFLNEDAIDAIHDRGLMALISFANSGQVRLAGFRSIASPAAPLEGPWVRQ